MLLNDGICPFLATLRKYL